MEKIHGLHLMAKFCRSILGKIKNDGIINRVNNSKCKDMIFSKNSTNKGLTIASVIVLAVIIIILAFTGCGNPEPQASYYEITEYPLVKIEAKDRNVEVSTEENLEASFAESNVKGGDVSVEKNLVSENAYFYTYITKNDVKMQIIFVLAPNGSLRVGLNTSEECKGEPDAYYIQGEGIFKCAHCGHVVANGEVGLGTNTAAPLGISYEENNGNILIKESDLLAYESYFTDWKGPTE